MAEGIGATICLLILFWYVWGRRIKLPTAAGAMAMAMGIMINGAFQQVKILRDDVGPYVTVALIGVLFWLFLSYFGDSLYERLYDQHFKHPIVSFATGTWVAGISVTTISIIKELPEFRAVPRVLYILAVFFWAVHFWLVIRNYRMIFKNKKERLIDQVHGILLLACVSTQSIVLAGNIAYHATFPGTISIIGILLGIAFYILGLALILIRYVWREPEDLANEWQNTNCIIHGAMSITGLACVKSLIISPDIIAIIWLWVCMTFIMVEIVEIVRCMDRWKKYGWKIGVFQYSVSQWARNFTFGMFLAFTINFSFTGSFLEYNDLFETVRTVVLDYGRFVVVALFIIEIILLLDKKIDIKKDIVSPVN